MALATSNRTQISFAVESAFGTIPGTGSKALRQTGNSLNFDLKTDTSKEIRSDRQITDVILVGASAAGSVNFELSYGEFEPLLEAALMGTWGSWGTNGVGAVIPTSATFAAGTLTAGAATSGTSIFTNLTKGQFVKFSGSTINGQNIVAQVSKTVSPTTTVLTFEGTPFTGLTGNGGAAVVLQTLRLTNGTTERSFAVELGFTDIAQYFTYRGMTVAKLALSFQSGAPVTGSFDFTGKDTLRAGSSAMGSIAASKAYDVMNAVNGVGNVLENGVALSGTFIKSLKLSLDNKLRARDAIGTLGAVSIGAGTLEVSGEIEVYLNDGTLYDKFVNNTATALSWTVQDGSGNGYAFQLPKVKYSAGKVTSGSLDQDCMISLPFQGLMDAATLKTLLIDRVGVTPV